MEDETDLSLGEMLSIDPAYGVTSSVGVSHWKNGKLIGCSRVQLDKDERKVARGEDNGARCQRMARQVLAWVNMRGARPRTLVYEWPQIYRAARSPGDPNDLIGLSAVGAAVGMGVVLLMSAQDIGVRIRTCKPGEWAGQVPKARSGNPWLSARGQRIATRLAPEERDVVPHSHDALDSVGIGLHFLGRLQQRRMFPGATP